MEKAISKEAIRKRAYELWEEWGRPETAADKFWLLAEDELVRGAPSDGRRDIVS